MKLEIQSKIFRKLFVYEFSFHEMSWNEITYLHPPLPEIFTYIFFSIFSLILSSLFTKLFFGLYTYGTMKRALYRDILYLYSVYFFAFFTFCYHAIASNALEVFFREENNQNIDFWSWSFFSFLFYSFCSILEKI